MTKMESINTHGTVNESQYSNKNGSPGSLSKQALPLVQHSVVSKNYFISND